MRCSIDFAVPILLAGSLATPAALGDLERLRPAGAAVNSSFFVVGTVEKIEFL